MYPNYGHTPTVYGEVREAKDAAAATKTAELLKRLHKELKTDPQFIQRRMTRYADKGRMKGPSFKEGDKVYLAHKNIKTKRPSDKLDYINRLNPSKSSERFQTLTTNCLQIHPIFHISLLEPAPPRAQLNRTTELEEEEYDVEKILDHRRSASYLAKWKGFGNDENTWEPLSHLTNAQGMPIIGSRPSPCCLSHRPNRNSKQRRCDITAGLFINQPIRK